jgi:hypothetical protein
MMKNIAYLVVIGTWLLVFCCTSFADERCSWCGADSPEVNKDIFLRCLIGQLAIDTANPSEAKRTIGCVIEQWKIKDGAIGSSISDTFLGMMEINPHVFFEVMADNETIFTEWLNELEVLSFTWFKRPPSPLEQKRKQLVQFLSKIGPFEKRRDALRQKLLSTLKNIKPRQVDQK